MRYMILIGFRARITLELDFRLGLFHILHSEAATGWGGQEIRVFQESRLLLERGHRVTVVCQPDSPMAERCRTVADPKFRFHPVAMRRTLSATAFLALCRIIGGDRPDILHTHSSIDSWLVSFCGKVLGIPVIRSRHVSIPVKNCFPKNLVYSFFPERILTSGEAIRTIMVGLSGVTAEKVISIGSGVDMQRFDCALSGETFRRELNLDDRVPLIGKIGVIRGWKGHDCFLEAIPLVLREIPEARFVIVGTGPGFEEIRQKIGTRGLEPVVTMLGHREDVPRILAALDVMVLASTAGEGTPQVIPQAFAMKTPVVATRTGEIPMTLGEGERGNLARPNDAPGLARGILDTLQNPGAARERSERAYRYCRDNLTVAAMMDKTIAVYEDVLRARS
jgi:glycosyltransferase involved in cell wall biosynthesis